MTLNSQLALFCSGKGKCIWTNWLFLHGVDHIISNWPRRVKYLEYFFVMEWGREGGRRLLGNRGND